MAKTFNREALLGAKPKVKKVKAGNLGFTYIRQLNARQMLEYKEKARLYSKDGEINDVDSLQLLALLICYAVCDESGKLLYTEDDIPAMLENSFDTLLELGTLSESILQFSGIDIEKAKEVAANLKNAQKGTSTIN